MMFDLSKIFDLSKAFAVPDFLLKSKNYSTTKNTPNMYLTTVLTDLPKLTKTFAISLKIALLGRP